MFETEANELVASSSEIPEDVLARFSESRRTVTHRTLIPWGEHCTECVWPTCYNTCELYLARVDGRCRRFVEGMVRLDYPAALNSYILKIRFRRWAKLWSPATLRTCSLSGADRAERRDQMAAAWIRAVPVRGLRKFTSLKRYALKKRRAMRNGGSSVRPDCLLIECYNPNAGDVSMTVAIRRDGNPIQFQAAAVMKPGFNRHRITVEEIERLVDLSGHFHIEVTPNDIPEGLTLYFGALDFVVGSAFVTTESDAAKKNDKPQICKCVIWDLDNTLWDGTLVEDGPERLRLKPGIPEILKALDERGILLSIASKNTAEDAMAVLRRFSLDEYFLCPQISWQPKSQGVRRIAASLNIGLDSLRFIDDSPFERAEVGSNCPGLVVIDAEDYAQILGRPDCQYPVTEESRKRRLLYRDQQRRVEAERGFQGDYLNFLKDCDLKLTIRPMGEENIERVHELTQRTNQMNFSGNRYSRNQLMDLLRRDDLDTYVLDCSDRFGSYGTIGFGLVRRDEVRMTDLMFSCRVQGKRVEHAFVSYLINRYREGRRLEFLVDYRKTAKNIVPGKVFDDLGFQRYGDCDGAARLVFPVDASVPEEGIVTIEDERTHLCDSRG
jgi:FkbH-like protein